MAGDGEEFLRARCMTATVLAKRKEEQEREVTCHVCGEKINYEEAKRQCFKGHGDFYNITKLGRAVYICPSCEKDIRGQPA